MKPKRTAILIALIIIFYGIFKIWFCKIYSVPISGFIEVLGYSSRDFLDDLNAFSIRSSYKNHYLGWFIYYPTYILLHLLFVFFLFSDNKVIRNKICIGLIISIIALLMIIFLSKYGNYHLSFEISYSLFQNLFSLPFILLLIEGGRTLVMDVDRMISKMK